jgi:hypothetical protein
LNTELFSDELRVKQFEVLKEAQAYVLDLVNWHEFMNALVKAGYRSEKMVTSKMSLLYSYIMFLVGKKDFKVDSYRLRNLIARWFFMSSITGRYTSSPESAMEMDLSALRVAKSAEDFIKTLDKIINDVLTEDFWNITLPNDLEAASVRSPSLFAYFAALNLGDAHVLFSKMKVSELLDPIIRAKKTALEVHHLFPKNYLHKIGFTETIETNQIGNYALLEWPDNLDISDLSPREYLSKYFPRLSKDMQYWHALPEGWKNMDYLEFLNTRRKLIAQVTRDGYQKLLEIQGQA